MHATTVSWPPSRTSTPIAAASLACDAPDDGDERAAAAPGLRRDDAVGAVRLDHGQLVHDGPEVAATGSTDQPSGAEHDLDRPVGALDRD